MDTTAELLAAHKARHKLTDQQIADEMGVSQPSVSDWLKGRVVPDDSRVEALARFLGVDEDEMAAINSFSRRKRAADLGEAMGQMAQLEGAVRRLRAEVAELRAELAALRPQDAPRKKPGQRKRQG